MSVALVVAAHPDDEVLGVGATIARLRADGVDIHIGIVTDGSSTQYPNRPDLVALKKTQAARALDVLGGGTLHFGDLPDMKLDTVPLITVNAFVESLVHMLRPNIVFTHHAGDLNADHRIVHEATVVACRPGPRAPTELLAYDVLGVTNYGGTRNTFQPTVFVSAESHAQRKADALAAYDVELRPFPHPRSPEALMAQGRVYGALAGVAWAEAFQPLRIIR